MFFLKNPVATHPFSLLTHLTSHFSLLTSHRRMPFRFFTITLLIFIYSSAAGQDTKPVLKKFPHSRQVAECYQVLKSNKEIKHGDYVSYFPLQKEQYKSVKKVADSLEHFVKQRGIYQYGKKHGAWVEFSSPGILYSKGEYDQGKQTGVWITSRENGEVMERYDHTSRQKLVPEIRIRVKYPPKARTAGIQGEVLIQYRLQADCSVSDLQVVQSLSAECDREATQKLLKYYRYLKTYGPAQGCEAKTDTFKVSFKLE